MNILHKVLSYDKYVRTPGIELSPSEVGGKSKYQMWLKKNGAKEVHPVDLMYKVNAIMGTALHEYASEALQGVPDVYSELPLKGDIVGVSVGGTADVIRIVDDTYIVGDFKTVGVFQLKKALKTNFESYKTQLSIYSYLYAQSLGIEYSRLGEIYMLVTGDAGYFAKKDGGGKTPKYLTEGIELLTKKEVEELVVETMSSIQEEPEMDCQSWMGPYCPYECMFRGIACGSE